MSEPVGTVEVTIVLDDYGEEAMFMRSVLAEGETPDGTHIEVANNELGAGIIVTVGKRKFVLREDELATAVAKTVGK